MKVELTLETVTPLFLGGAKQEAELRPASVRGALRFWFRAMMGGVIGDNNLGTLADLEASVFGRTEMGSAVTVRLSQPNFRPASEPLLPHRAGNTAGFTNAVPAETPFAFDLMLTLRPRQEVRLLEVATWSALLWLTLGGVGRRSRRGAGSLQIKVNTNDAPTIAVPDGVSENLIACLNAAATTPADKQVLADQVANFLDKARQAFAAFAPPTTPRFSRGLPCFSVLLPDTRVVLWNPPNSNLDDYKTALAPLMNKLSKRMADDSRKYRDGFGGIHPSRRASPLLVTTHRLANEWALSLTHLKAKIRANSSDDEDGNSAEVTAFLDGLDSKVEAYPRLAEGGNTS